MKKIFLIIFLLVCAKSFAQTLPYKQWKHGYKPSATNWNAGVYDSKLDKQGNLIIVGAQDSGSSTTTPKGGIITKFKRQGGVDWTVSNPGYYPSLNGLKFYGVEIDNQNNIYAAGRSDSILFNGKKAALIKYSPDGSIVWEKYLGISPYYKECGFNDVHIDAEGNIIASGYVLTTNGGNDTSKLFIAKYNPSGSVIWIQMYLTTMLRAAYSMNTRIATDNASNIWIFYEGFINSGKGVAAITKFNSSGTSVWGTIYQGSNNAFSDNVVDIKIGPDNSPVLFYMLNNTSPSFTTICITKLDAIIYSQIFNKGYGVAFDSAPEMPGNLIVNSSNEIYFCFSSRTSSLTDYEGLLYKLTPDGNEVWIKTFNTYHQSSDYMTKIGLDNENNIYALAYSGAYIRGYVIKYNSSGNKIWETNFTPNSFYNYYNYLHIGASKEIYLALTNTFLSGAEIAGYKFIQVPGQLSQPVRNISKPILDFQDTYDTINVTGLPNSAVVLNLQVKIDSVIHSYPHDLTFHLTSPSGYRDSIIKEPGAFVPGTGYFRTQLADSSLKVIDSASNPFTGFYRPHRFLSSYNFLKAGGNWILRIRDNANSDTGTLYKWGLVITYYDTLLTEIKTVIMSNIPEGYKLSQNYPNPFNPVTKINFEIPNNSKVKLQIFDITGKLVSELINIELTAGHHTTNFDGTYFASGTYFYRLAAGDFIETKKMILIK